MLTKKQGVANLARAEFDKYAGMDRGELPTDRLSALQVRLCRWQVNNLPDSDKLCCALGVAEEAGEIAHAVLKEKQRIRGFDDRDFARAHVADGIADCAIYLMQLATAYRLDFGVLLQLVAEDVMQRNWKANPLEAGNV